MTERNRCDDITDLIDAALEDVLSTGGIQRTYDPMPGQQGDWLDDWWDIDGDLDDLPDRMAAAEQSLYDWLVNDAVFIQPHIDPPLEFRPFSFQAHTGLPDVIIERERRMARSIFQIAEPSSSRQGPPSSEPSRGPLWAELWSARRLPWNRHTQQ